MINCTLYPTSSCGLGAWRRSTKKKLRVVLKRYQQRKNNRFQIGVVHICILLLPLNVPPPAAGVTQDRRGALNQFTIQREIRVLGAYVQV